MFVCFSKDHCLTMAIFPGEGVDLVPKVIKGGWYASRNCPMRVGIAHSNSRLRLIALPRVLLVDLLPYVGFAFIYIYLMIGVSVFLLPCSILNAPVLSAVIPANHRWHDPMFIYSQISGAWLKCSLFHSLHHT